MRTILQILKGIAITCIGTFVVFLAWFYIREEVMGNRDNLIALAVQILVCAAFLFAGCVISIAKALTDVKPAPQNPPDKECELLPGKQ